MAKHETMSAWFWITNSWLSTGGLLFFLRKPMAHRLGSPSSRSGLPGLELAVHPLHGCCWPERLNWWRLARLGSGLVAPLRSVSTVNPLLMCLKTVMKMHRTRPNTTAQHPLFSCLPGEVRWRALPLQNPIHEPPSVIDVEGEPRSVVPSGTPRKRPFTKTPEGWL